MQSVVRAGRAYVVTCVLVVSAALSVAACGSSTKSSSQTHSSPSTATSGSASGGGSAQAQAKQIVAKYTAGLPFSVAPLTKRPPSDKSVAVVDCTFPVCNNGAVAAPAKLLGWRFIDEPFQITAGPSAYVAAFTRALQAKPNYIILIGVFPPPIVAAQLAQAKKEGIVVLGLAGTTSDPAFARCVACTQNLLLTGKLGMDLAVAKYGPNVKLVAAQDTTSAETGPLNAGLTGEAARLHANKPAFVNVSTQASAAANDAAVVSYLQRNPDTQAIFADLPDDLTGLPGALAQAGLAGKVTYYSAAGQADQMSYIRDGSMAATVSFEAVGGWWRAVDTLARISVGDPYSHSESGWFRIVNQQNVASVLAAGGLSEPEPPHFEAAYAKAWKAG